MLYKYRSGLIFDDTFQAMKNDWIYSVPSAVRLHTDLVRLSHSRSGTMMLLNLPHNESELVLEVEASYGPVDSGDMGGLIIWKSPDECLEFLESVDTSHGDYSRWRAVKYGLQWDFYARINQDWEYFDTGELDANKIGVTLQGESGVPLDITRVTVCRGEYVGVGNLMADSIVTLKDKNGAVVETHVVPDGYSGVNIRLPLAVFEGEIKVIEEGETQTIATTFYGGDMYLYATTPLKIYRDGVELNRIDFSDWGYFRNRDVEMKLQLVNSSDNNLHNIKVKASQHESDVAYQWIILAEDMNGLPGEYRGDVAFSQISGDETKDFWLRIERARDYFGFNPLQFKLDITHD
ncbi:hypothetical protein DFP93_101251 [Aneurinibacillus soli]|uniref:Uncharacterized protein n=1 Tax=Aneurinibacillus soli TaxID=1500254 RepID=A0A0U5BJ16_9BACL|nr:hypothetical protein [Aneurinibacillus soli]PYE64225.1 hypothetical protein DFP93_101251 [Aneurinibacillus soli]BAU28174.1 hypothetical protein CB4_02348 [Aneurinibacillus soli]